MFLFSVRQGIHKRGRARRKSGAQKLNVSAVSDTPAPRVKFHI
jgi:hypothetical protein